MVRVLLVAVASLLLGCAGASRDLSRRLEVERGDPELLEVRCGTVTAAEVPAPGVGGVTVDQARGGAPVGELFDWRRRSEQNPALPLPARQVLAIDADAFGSTVRSDVERILRLDTRRSAPDAAPQLVLRILDVQTITEPAGWTELRGRVSSRVVLRATVRGDGGEELWSAVLEGESEKRVFHFGIVHHETTLSAAYCSALTRFGAAVPDLARALVAARSGKESARP
jgi:hypothetical protein